MAEQYFTADPTCESKQVPCSFVYRGHGLNFMTDAGVFSKGELDTGTRLLLDALPDVYGDVLDLGCGWGAIGVWIAMILDWICRLTCFILRYRGTKWEMKAQIRRA